MKFLPDVREKLTMLLIVVTRTDAHSLRNQVGIESESDCLLGQSSHHITSHGKDGCRPQWPLYPRNKYLYTTLLLTSI